MNECRAFSVQRVHQDGTGSTVRSSVSVPAASVTQRLASVSVRLVESVSTVVKVGYTSSMTQLTYIAYSPPPTSPLTPTVAIWV